MANYTWGGTGGAGAGYHAIIKITSSGYYNIVVGSGGQGIGGGKGSSVTGNNGSATTMTKQGGATLISAGGGTGGSGYSVHGTAGTGGTLTKSSGLTEAVVYKSSNGNNGTSYAGGSGLTLTGAAGPISGHTWGSSGNASAGYNGGRVTSSKHGYVLLKYRGHLSY